MIGNETRPRRLWLRLSVEEDDALAKAAGAYGVNKTDLIRLFAHYVQLPCTHLLSGAPIVFDYATSHEVSYNLHDRCPEGTAALRAFTHPSTVSLPNDVRPRPAQCRSKS